MLAACASDEPVGVADDTDAGSGGGVDAAPPPPPPKQDAAPPVDSAPAKKCVSSCTSDQDCANSCPAVANGVNCCDTATGVCFSSQTQQCPAPPVDSGTPPPAY